ncbi:subtilase, partial [Bisporella sp. PMI_857]
SVMAVLKMLPRIFLPLFAAVAVLSAPLAPILDLGDIIDLIADNFIVVLNPLSDSEFSDFLAGRQADIVSSTTSIFDIGSFKGFSGIFTRSLLDTLASLASVNYIEPVTRVKASALTSQANSPWGLSRISHRQLGATNYIYDTTAGSGTYAYVIDTGIYTGHRDFGGRASFGVNFAGDGQNTDGNGHGTHIAGTIGSATYGVAKKTNIIAVKVLDSSGSGTSTGVISGIQWAVNDAKAKKRIGKAVANISLGGGYSRATNDAVAAATLAGLFMGVAAGNDNRNAMMNSPASEASACTVGASTRNDAKASFSNYGSVVDIFAPGTDIISTWITGDTSTNTISGTSMATPHIVGLAAYLLSLEGGEPRKLCDRIKALATSGALSGVSGGSPGL